MQNFEQRTKIGVHYARSKYPNICQRTDVTTITVPGDLANASSFLDDLTAASARKR